MVVVAVREPNPSHHTVTIAHMLVVEDKWCTIPDPGSHTHDLG